METAINESATAIAQPLELVEVLRAYRAESGRTLLELVDESPVLLIFLRHFGCAFCRQAIDTVSQIKDQIAARGVRPVFVHLGTPERAKQFFDYYGLETVERVGNPDGSLYRQPVFHLPQRNRWLLTLNPAVLYGWLRGGLKKYGIGKFEEDGSQMPGVFVLRGRKITNVFRYRRISDEPDYLRLIDRG